MPSIAAIDSRCFLPPQKDDRRQPSHHDWTWERITQEARAATRRGEPTPAHLHSLIRRHFALAAA